MKTPLDIAQRIAFILKNKNFDVHIQKSRTTKSVYIKIDYGLGCTIRVSDHQPRKVSSYRYNVLPTVEKSFEKNDGSVHYYYDYSQIHFLINDISKRRKFIFNKIGRKHYNYLLNQHKRNFIIKNTSAYKQKVYG